MQLRSLSAIGASQKVADRWPRPISMSQWLKRETFPLKASSDSDRQGQIGGLFTVRTGRQPFTATSSAVNNPHPHRIRPSSDNPLVKKKIYFHFIRPQIYCSFNTHRQQRKNSIRVNDFFLNKISLTAGGHSLRSIKMIRDRVEISFR